MEIFENAVMPIVVILIIAAIMIIANKGNARKDMHYDEMQLKIRADGYKIGFFVTLGVLFTFGFLSELIDTFGKVFSMSFCMMAAGFAGIVTFVLYCIFKDVFYSIGQNRRGYMILCVCVIIANGIGSVRHISEGTFLEDGMVTFSNCGTILCAVSFFLILIALIMKEVSTRKEVDE